MKNPVERTNPPDAFLLANGTFFFHPADGQNPVELAPSELVVLHGNFNVMMCIVKRSSSTSMILPMIVLMTIDNASPVILQKNSNIRKSCPFENGVRETESKKIYRISSSGFFSSAVYSSGFLFCERSFDLIFLRMIFWDFGIWDALRTYERKLTELILVVCASRADFRKFPCFRSKKSSQVYTER